jgi:hypothetical protein
MTIYPDDTIYRIHVQGDDTVEWGCGRHLGNAGLIGHHTVTLVKEPADTSRICAACNREDPAKLYKRSSLYLDQRILNAEIMFGTHSPQHIASIKRFG